MSSHANLPHWNYFRLLERDLEECFKFVAPAQEHFAVHSDRFAQIILLACSELENAMARFADAAACNPRPGSIGAYQAFVLARYPAFCSMRVGISRFSLDLEPWSGWTPTDAPEWWTYGYNKIKHDRIGHPGAPSLYRAISAVGGLLVMLLHLYTFMHGEQCNIPFELAPLMFEPLAKDIGIESASISWSWQLPLAL